MSKTKEDIVTPVRYTSQKVECWDFWLHAGLNPIIASAVKYVWRYKHKNGKEDLEKALVFIDKAMTLNPFTLKLSESFYELHPEDIEGFSHWQRAFMDNAVLSTHPKRYGMALRNMKLIVQHLLEDYD